ncbi:nSTAND1 domain-containing NTPase [Streptomyces sp. NBC_01708]|uniref:nSTAND1 domain-containing NTPase n=1 Tax=Streptomyces sp. NBC_01708 TaxID=2975915 RepID=UPI002E32563E|nr:trypsin-like peptidase domain-containing protein [Streptomyces sp. NBC_01708]
MSPVDEVGDNTFPNAAIVRIFRSAPEPDTATGALGVGFLVDDRHALTCAHVVAAALGLDGGEPSDNARLSVDLPFRSAAGDPATTPRESAATVTARIVQWGPSQVPDGNGPDVAVLRLERLVPGTGPARCVDMEPAKLRGYAAEIIGFPAGRPQGIWHEGVLRGPQAGGQVQIDRVGAGYRVTPGFSGSPVWSRDLGAVVGMTVRAERGEPAAGFMIPLSQLVASWPPLAALARPASPFRSLNPFEEAHAAAFFGRDADSDHLARVVGQQRWTTLVGPSGCGKSSLAMAGVAPRRRAQQDTVAVLRPAHHSTALGGLAAVVLDLLEPDCPEAERFARIAAVADEIGSHGLREVAARVLRVQGATRLLIIVDQFEELLDEESYDPGDIDALAEALGAKAPPTVGVLAVLRADFLGPVLAHPRLGLLAKKRIEALEPMRQEQLRDVISKPVDDLPAIAYEDALVHRILADVGDAPGILPLLSFTLAQLWEDQRGGQLTHDAYDALGGVRGALGSHANAVWEQYVDEANADDDRELDPDGQGSEDGNREVEQRWQVEDAERLLTRLVRTPVGTDTPLRRLVTRGELTEGEWLIAQRLAGARLLVISRARSRENTGPLGPGPAGLPPTAQETIELAHEALISRWGRLSSRVKEDRVFLDWRENLQFDMDRWERAGRIKELLPTDVALDAAGRWLPARGGELGQAQREYIELGHAHRRYLTRRRRMLYALFGALLLAVSVTAGVAIDQSRTVAHQRDRATSAQVAGLAQSLGATDPELARRLAVAAARLGDTPEAWSGLLEVRNQVEKRAVRLPDFDVTTSALDDDGRILVAGGGTHVGTWNVDTGEQLGSYRTAQRVRNVRLSGDGTTVAVSTDDETTVVLEARGLRRRGHPYPTGPAVFSLSPEGTYLASVVARKGGGYGATVWHTRTGELRIQRTGEMPFKPSFFAGEKRLSLTSSQETGKTVIWADLTTGKDLPVPDFGIKHTDYPGPLAFSPDLDQAAVLTEDGLRVSDLYDDGEVGTSDFQQVPEQNDDQGLYGDDVHFSHDGRLVSVGFTLWDATSAKGGEPVFTYPTPISFCDAGTFRFSSDDTELRCVGEDGTFRSVDISHLSPHGTEASVSASAAAVVASEDGSTIAVQASGDSGIQIWSTAPLVKRARIPVPQVAHILLSPDGRLLAIPQGLTKVQIWDTEKRTRLGTLPGFLGGFTRTVAFSPDGTTYATYDGAGNAGSKGYRHSLRFYDLKTMELIGKKTFTLRTALLDFGTTVTFRPDGKALTVSPLLGTVAVPSGKVLVPGTTGLHLDGYGPDGTTAYTDPDSVHSTLTFLDPRTLRSQGQPLDLGAPVSYDAPVAHSPDGRLIAVAQQNATAADPSSEVEEIKIWDLLARRQVGPSLKSSTGSVALLTFTADSSALVTLDGQEFRTYPVARSRLVDELCAMADGGLTEEEWQEHIPDVSYRKTC